MTNMVSVRLGMKKIPEMQCEIAFQGFLCIYMEFCLPYSCRVSPCFFMVVKKASTNSDSVGNKVLVPA